MEVARLNQATSVTREGPSETSEPGIPDIESPYPTDALNT